MTNTGGYEDGYSKCDCFWGRDPGSLIRQLLLHRSDIKGMKVWDVGCGEGKNAIYLARLGAFVDAWDISELAIANGRDAWPDSKIVTWTQGDIRLANPAPEYYDLVVMYGILHCLASHEEIRLFVQRAQCATKRRGCHIVVAFNRRRQELKAHPGFTPTLASHEYYLSLYHGWNVVFESDLDLHESHPHNCIPHVHSMTRLIAEKT